MERWLHKKTFLSNTVKQMNEPMQPWDSWGPLDNKIKPVNPKGNQPWVLIGRTDAGAEAPVFWSPDANSWLTGKVPDPGKDWWQKKKRASEDEMAGWHHWCNGHELGQTLGNGEGQGDLACCSPWGSKESDTTGQLNNNNKSWIQERGDHQWSWQQQYVRVVGPKLAWGGLREWVKRN